MNAPVNNNAAPSINAESLRKALNGEEVAWADTGFNEETIKKFDKDPNGKMNKDEAKDLLKSTILKDGGKESADTHFGSKDEYIKTMDHLADSTKGGKVDGTVTKKDKMRLFFEIIK